MSGTESILTAVLVAVAVGALVWAEVRSVRLGVWIAKPVASTMFVGTAILAGAAGSRYGQLILLALVLSWLGDVLLIPKRQIYFISGLGSFLLAHLVFGAAFLHRPQEPLPAALGAVVMAVVAGAVLRWLWPHLSRMLRPAVAAYVGAISWMVLLAAGTVRTGGGALALAAVAFAASDMLVARHRFVVPSAVNKVAGLPLYYTAQMVFAWSVQGWSP